MEQGAPLLQANSMNKSKPSAPTNRQMQFQSDANFLIHVAEDLLLKKNSVVSDKTTRTSKLCLEHINVALIDDKP